MEGVKADFSFRNYKKNASRTPLTLNLIITIKSKYHEKFTKQYPCIQVDTISALSGIALLWSDDTRLGTYSRKITENTAFLIMFPQSMNPNISIKRCFRLFRPFFVLCQIEHLPTPGGVLSQPVTLYPRGWFL